MPRIKSSMQRRQELRRYFTQVLWPQGRMSAPPDEGGLRPGLAMPWSLAIICRAASVRLSVGHRINSGQRALPLPRRRRSEDWSSCFAVQCALAACGMLPCQSEHAPQPAEWGTPAGACRRHIWARPTASVANGRARSTHPPSPLLAARNPRSRRPTPATDNAEDTARRRTSTSARFGSL